MLCYAQWSLWGMSKTQPKGRHWGSSPAIPMGSIATAQRRALWGPTQTLTGGRQAAGKLTQVHPKPAFRVRSSPGNFKIKSHFCGFNDHCLGSVNRLPHKNTSYIYQTRKRSSLNLKLKELDDINHRENVLSDTKQANASPTHSSSTGHCWASETGFCFPCSLQNPNILTNSKIFIYLNI